MKNHANCYHSMVNLDRDLNLLPQVGIHHNFGVQQCSEATDLVSRLERLGELIGTKELSQTLLI